MSGIQVNLLKLVMELIIYSEGQSLRTPFGKKQGSCISVYMYAYMSARQNLRHFGTVTPGHRYLILS